MKGQVLQSLYRAIDLPEDRIRCPEQCHWYAVRKAAIANGIRGKARIDPDPTDLQAWLKIEEQNRKDSALHDLIRLFLN